MKAIDNSAEWVLFPSYISWKNKVFKIKRFQYSSKENIVGFKPDKFKLSLSEDNQTSYRWQLPTIYGHTCLGLFVIVTVKKKQLRLEWQLTNSLDND